MNLKLLAISLVIFGILSRLIPHAPNITGIGALMLFGGVYLPKRFAFLPLAALFISDYFIGFYGISMIYVYFSFGLAGLIGIWLKDHKSLKNIFGATLITSIIFYLITNFGVWTDPRSAYSKDLAGLMQSYYYAIPFFRNTILGDLSYTALLFGSYEFIMNITKRHLSKSIYRLLF
ncbi:hypothetical protein HY386_00295 [Candidatus Daviesbacteria bacterium]|nr:hypothetical protein [Candidatus Daviesbacteria bacterium]